MDLKSLVKSQIMEQIIPLLMDRDETPGLSPCFVRAMIEDRLQNLGYDHANDEQVLQAALSGAITSADDVVSASQSTQWLCTRYIPLPLCENSPWEIMKLRDQLLLLRGGVQALYENPRLIL